ncbi:hypothetical protein ACF91D_28595 [Staphylococcus sp. 231237_7MaSpsaltlick]|uniref:hypothetical protein n=1 Tax=Staphylococcus TaxID=1279 RepID=UPI00370BAF93
MNRIAQIKFVEDMESVSEVGYLQYATGEVEPTTYIICYSATCPLQERFTLYVDEGIVNLKQYVSEADLYRIHDAYFDFRTSYKDIEVVTVQLLDCYRMCS